MFRKILNWFNVPVKLSRSDVQQANPDFATYEKLQKEVEVDPSEYSVIERVMETSQSKLHHEVTNTYKQFVYGALSTDKVRRLRFYRNMAGFPEISDAIDEIVDSCLNYDENSNFVNLLFPNIIGDGLNDNQKKSLRKEFDEFISLFEMEKNHFDYFRSFVTDGEITWENIVDPKKPEFGIIGLNRLPPESYEYLLNDKGYLVGIAINCMIDKENATNIFTPADKTDTRFDVMSKYNIQNLYSPRNSSIPVVPFLLNQVTHVNSGSFNDDKTVVFPILEKARRAYRQLNLLEDSIIIYRLVRAPERLVFNVDTGKLPPSRAEEMVLKMMKRYQSKKVYDPVNGTVVNDYDPHQMLESYWFPKPEGGGGTDVSSLSTNASLGELEDLYYFLRKLYVSLKVPYDRFKEPGNQQPGSEETMSYEEYRFAKFIMRIQNQFAAGLMNSFRTHLQLKGLWQQFKLNDRVIKVELVKPATYDLYIQKKLLTAKLENYKSVSELDEFSKEIAMKKYLGFTEKEIAENNERKTQEILKTALIEKQAENITSEGSIVPKTEEEKK